jgi:hypothetical protein
MYKYIYYRTMQQKLYDKYNAFVAANLGRVIFKIFWGRLFKAGLA